MFPRSTLSEEYISFKNSLKNLTIEDKKSLVLDFCNKNIQSFDLIIINLFLNYNLIEEIQILFEDEKFNALLKNNNILKNIYQQSPQVITFFINHNLINVSTYKELLLNKAISNNDLDFLSLVLEKTEPFRLFDSALIVNPIIDQNKPILSILLSSDKFKLNDKLIDLLVNLCSTKNTSLIPWLLSFPKVSNLFKTNWKNNIQDKEAAEFISFILSIRSF